MLFTTQRTEQEFLLKMDPYGDSYTEDATDQSLKEVPINMKGGIYKTH
jgi:hypothetical protein